MATKRQQALERQQQLWNALRSVQMCWVLFTTKLTDSGGISMRACDLFQKGGTNDRIGLRINRDAPSSSVSLQAFAGRRQRDVPAPILLFGNGFSHEETGAHADVSWPTDLHRPRTWLFDGEVIAAGDNYGKYVTLTDARTKTDFDLGFVHRGMSLSELVKATEHDDSIPCWILPPRTIVHPTLIGLTTKEFRPIRERAFPNRIFITSGYRRHGKFDAASLELPPNWRVKDEAQYDPISVRSTLLDLLEELPLFDSNGDSNGESTGDEAAKAASNGAPAAAAAK